MLIKTLGILCEKLQMMCYKHFKFICNDRIMNITLKCGDL